MQHLPRPQAIQMFQQIGQVRRTSSQFFSAKKRQHLTADFCAEREKLSPISLHLVPQKQTITEHDHRVETHTDSNFTRTHNRADGTARNSLIFDMGSVDVRGDSKMVRCTLQNGSAWSMEKKYMKKYKGTSF